MVCFLAGFVMGSVLGVVLLLGWAAFAVATEAERLIGGDGDEHRVGRARRSPQ